MTQILVMVFCALITGMSLGLNEKHNAPIFLKIWNVVNMYATMACTMYITAEMLR